jgi:SAM-dependent methyltransferase
MDDLVSKYDRLSEGFAESSYANLVFDMHRRLSIAMSWGNPLLRGDSVFELGCGDGYLAQLFAQHGLQYTGLDISPKMVEVATRRLQEAGLKGVFRVGDVAQIPLAESYDAIFSYMHDFFSYTQEPLVVLQRVRPFVRKKLIVDLNPRGNISLREGLAMLQVAGFRHVTWRPFFVPKEKRLPIWLLKAFAICEDISLIRTIPLRWKFLCLLEGEP